MVLVGTWHLSRPNQNTPAPCEAQNCSPCCSGLYPLTTFPILPPPIFISLSLHFFLNLLLRTKNSELSLNLALANQVCSLTSQKHIFHTLQGNQAAMQPQFGMRCSWIIGNWQTEEQRIVEAQSILCETEA